MTEERLLSSAPSLRSHRAFVAMTAADLRIVPRAGWRLFIRGMQARYRQTRLRWAWVVLPGIATTAVWVYVSRVGIVSIGHTRVPYVVYVLGGVLLWQLFLDSLNAPLARLTAARESLTKSRLPHEAYVLAGLLEAMFTFLVRLVLFAGVLVAAGTSMRWTLVLAPVGAVALAALGLAIGLLLAPGGLLYQDVGYVLMIATGFLFFLTPVVYPRPAHGIATLLVRLNPVTPLLVSTRAWATGDSGATPGSFAAVLALALLLLLLAWIIYRLARPHLVARL